MSFNPPSSTQPVKPPDRTAEEVRNAALAERLRAGLASGRRSTILGASTGLFGSVNTPMIKPGVLA